MNPQLGCIADDFTGATDLAGMLVRSGMRVVQVIDVPTEPLPRDVDAIVIALKSRTLPVDVAVAESLAALESLREAGCQQFYFKYCSTFDSTDRGNIGPVTDALMKALDATFTIACPAFPENGRTVYKGHMFVGDVLLNESGMRHHPLTPMADANLVRVLQRQTQRKIGLISHTDVSAGPTMIKERIGALKKQGIEIAIVDAISNADLVAIGEACARMPLVTAGSGLALGLPQNFYRDGAPMPPTADLPWNTTDGFRAVVSGSCSVKTQAQVAHMMSSGAPAFEINPLLLADGNDVVNEALAWAKPQLSKGPVLIYATAAPDAVKQVQNQLGVEKAGMLVENALSQIAAGLVKLGVGQMVVAGGETSGAVVKAFNVSTMRIGPEIDPGVPWTLAMSNVANRSLALALKSGNFGSDDFFTKAWTLLK